MLWLAGTLLVRPAETKHIVYYSSYNPSICITYLGTHHIRHLPIATIFFLFSTIKITQALHYTKMWRDTIYWPIKSLPRVFEFLTDKYTWLWRWLPYSLSKCQSQATVLLRTPITQTIFFNQSWLFMFSKSLFMEIIKLSREYPFNFTRCCLLTSVSEVENLLTVIIIILDWTK